MSEGQATRARLAAAVRDIFGAKCKAAWLSGSFAYDGAQAGRSDIDAVIVFDERQVGAPAEPGTLLLIERFVDEYLVVHATQGFQPDLDFPGEFLTEALIEDAAAGRGLGCDAAPGQLSLSPLEDEHYWLDRPDRWSRAWLSMTAFSRYLGGSRDYHRAVKLRAWKTILRFVLLKAEGRPASSVDDLFDRLGQFGLKKSYRSFRDVEREWMERALSELAAEGSIQPGDRQIMPLSEPLNNWQGDLCRELSVGPGQPPLLLGIGETRRLSAYASKQWAAL